MPRENSDEGENLFATYHNSFHRDGSEWEVDRESGELDDEEPDKWFEQVNEGPIYGEESKEFEQINEGSIYGEEPEEQLTEK